MGGSGSEVQNWFFSLVTQFEVYFVQEVYRKLKSLSSRSVELFRQTTHFAQLDWYMFNLFPYINTILAQRNPIFLFIRPYLKKKNIYIDKTIDDDDINIQPLFNVSFRAHRAQLQRRHERAISVLTAEESSEHCCKSQLSSENKLPAK